MYILEPKSLQCGGPHIYYSPKHPYGRPFSSELDQNMYVHAPTAHYYSTDAHRPGWGGIAANHHLLNETFLLLKIINYHIYRRLVKLSEYLPCVGTQLNAVSGHA